MAHHFLKISFFIQKYSNWTSIQTKKKHFTILSTNFPKPKARTSKRIFNPINIHNFSKIAFCFSERRSCQNTRGKLSPITLPLQLKSTTCPPYPLTPAWERRGGGGGVMSPKRSSCALTSSSPFWLILRMCLRKLLVLKLRSLSLSVILKVHKRFLSQHFLGG